MKNLVLLIKQENNIVIIPIFKILKKNNSKKTD